MPKQLREILWIRVDQVGRPIILRPIIARQVGPTEAEVTCMVKAAAEPVPNEALLQAVAEIGVENPKRSWLGGLEIEPL